MTITYPVARITPTSALGMSLPRTKLQHRHLGMCAAFIVNATFIVLYLQQGVIIRAHI